MECRLLQPQAAVDLADNHGDTALMKSAWNGHGECIRLLIAKGAGPSLMIGWMPSCRIFFVS